MKPRTTLILFFSFAFVVVTSAIAMFAFQFYAERKHAEAATLRMQAALSSKNAEIRDLRTVEKARRDLLSLEFQSFASFLSDPAFASLPSQIQQDLLANFLTQLSNSTTLPSDLAAPIQLPTKTRLDAALGRTIARNYSAGRGLTRAQLLGVVSLFDVTEGDENRLIEFYLELVDQIDEMKLTEKSSEEILALPMFESRVQAITSYFFWITDCESLTLFRKKLLENYHPRHPLIRIVSAHEYSCHVRHPESEASRLARNELADIGYDDLYFQRINEYITQPRSEPPPEP